MSSDNSRNGGRSLGMTVGLALTLLVGILWVVYGMTGAQPWFLVVNIVISMLVGGYWVFGRQLLDGNRP